MSEEHLKSALKALRERYGLQESELMKYPPTLMATADKIVEISRVLRDEFKFNMLCELTAVDYYPENASRFHVIYGYYSHAENSRMMLRVPVNGDSPILPTLDQVFPGANWHERELWDMFGIKFEGSKDLRRVLMPYDWEGHPLRKDYPLGYEEPQFTFNIDEINKRKHRGHYEEA